MSILTLIKFTVVLAFASVFLIAINTLISFLITLVIPPIVSEILGLMSMYLPFNASAVFGSLSLIIEAIFIFMIANKVFNLNTWLIKDA